jgi:hypothetical protein
MHRYSPTNVVALVRVAPLALLTAAAACTPAATDSSSDPGTGGSIVTGGRAGGGTGGASGGSGGASAGGGTTGSSGGGPGSGGNASGGSGPAGSGGSGSGGTTGSGGTPGSSGGTSGSPDAGMVAETGAPPASGDIGGQLHGAYVELTCGSRIDPMFCAPKPGEADQKIMLKFGGEAGKTYDVVLKVWGIVEMQTFKGGMEIGEHMYVGGNEMNVGNANYSVYGLIAGETSYFLNRYPSAGGDKVVAMSYTSPPIKLPGASTLVLRHFDKNNHATRNFSKLSVPNPPAGLLAKIKAQPFDGSFLYIEVESAKESN